MKTDPCPECGSTDFPTTQGLKVHRSRAHGAGHTVTCGVCGHGFSNVNSLDAHGYKQHKPKGYSRRSWLEVKAASKQQPLSEIPAETPRLDSIVEGDRPSYRPRSRNGAEHLVDLPWLVYPKTEGECDDVLNGLALAIERSNGAGMNCLLSLRQIATELRRRFRNTQAAAA